MFGVWTTSECVSFISSPACNEVKFANHRGLRSQSAEAVVRPVWFVTFHVRLQAGRIMRRPASCAKQATKQDPCWVAKARPCFVCEARGVSSLSRPAFFLP